MLFRAEMARDAVYALPLDVCGADTQGATGYLLQQALRNWLLRQGLTRDVTTVVTQVIVDGEDPACLADGKGIGPFFDQDRARAYEKSRGWQFMMIPGHGFQRTVPALLPKKVIEANSIRYLLDREVVVICAGGGGVPVNARAEEQLAGVEAVVDKAHTATLLAQEIGAEIVVFVSAWSVIERAFPNSTLDGVTCLPRSGLNEFLEHRTRLEPSLRTKLMASQQFFENGGQSVLLVSPEQLAARPHLGWGVRLLADEVVSDQNGSI
jgi:carbamate kinase